MSDDAEKDLSAFLAGLPAYQRMELDPDISSYTSEDFDQWLEWLKTSPQQVTELRLEHERLLRRVPAKLKDHRERQMQPMQEALKEFASSLPKGQAGRKANVERAKRIWALHDGGRTSKEIQKILKADGVNLSREGVEAYLKARRRRRGR